MSDDISNPGRRTVLKKTGATAAFLAGATGSAAAGVGTQDTKDHYIRFEIDSGDGSGDYYGELPDPNPDTDNLESDDNIDYYSDHVHYNGNVDGSWQPRYDEYRFDGSLSSPDFSWNADPNVRVILDGTVVQS